MRANPARSKIARIIEDSRLIPGKPEKFCEHSCLFLRYRQVYESAFGAFIFQTTSHSENGFLVHLDLVSHLFMECPLPSGVFGRDGDVLSVLPHQVRSELYEKHYWGASWLKFQGEADFADFLRVVVEPSHAWMASNTKALLADGTLRVGLQVYNNLSISGEQPPVELIEKMISDKLKVLPTRSLRKLAGQLCQKLRKNPKWAQY